MIKTDTERKTELMNCIVWAGIWLMMLYALTACSVKFEIGYHGETAKDNRDFTSQAKK